MNIPSPPTFPPHTSSWEPSLTRYTLKSDGMAVQEILGFPSFCGDGVRGVGGDRGAPSECLPSRKNSHQKKGSPFSPSFFWVIEINSQSSNCFSQQGPRTAF